MKSGEMVKAGQVIAELEMDELERDLEGGKPDVERAQAKLKSSQDELARNSKEAQLNLEIARENLAIVRTQDPAPRKAEAELQQASLARQRAKQNYDALPAGPERNRRCAGKPPRLILAEEPTGELDSVTAREILELFARRSHEEHMTILVASHDPQVDALADHVCRLQDGRLAGSPPSQSD